MSMPDCIMSIGCMPFSFEYLMTIWTIEVKQRFLVFLFYIEKNGHVTKPEAKSEWIFFLVGTRLKLSIGGALQNSI